MNREEEECLGPEPRGINSELMRLQRKIGEEATERARLERLVVALTEALRPIRGIEPHAIVDTYTKAAMSAQRVLDAYARERSPDVVHIRQEFREANPAQAVGSPEEPDVAFYKRSAQSLRESLELEKSKGPAR